MERWVPAGKPIGVGSPRRNAVMSYGLVYFGSRVCFRRQTP